MHEIYVSHDSSNISVWAISSPSNLYYIAGKKSGSQYVWAEPLLFKKNVIHFAPLRTSKKKTNEVYTLTQDGSISHYWQVNYTSFIYFIKLLGNLLYLY